MAAEDEAENITEGLYSKSPTNVAHHPFGAVVFPAFDRTKECKIEPGGVVGGAPFKEDEITGTEGRDEKRRCLQQGRESMRHAGRYTGTDRLSPTIFSAFSDEHNGVHCF